MKLKCFLVDLSGLANTDELYQRIDFLGYETYPVVGKPRHYEVDWELQESINSLIPELPAERITMIHGFDNDVMIYSH